MDVLGILLVLVWLLAGGINAAQKRKRQQPPEPPRPRPRQPEGLPGQLARPPAGKRGSLLDMLRAEMERMQQEAEPAPTIEGPMGRRAVVQWPGLEEVEEREVLEVEPEVLSLEVAERITSREVVDQDDQAEALVRRRIEAAQSRDRALSVADHKAFDRTIRSAPAQSPVPLVGRRPASIRDAMVWREILGPPKGLQ